MICNKYKCLDTVKKYNLYCVNIREKAGILIIYLTFIGQYLTLLIRISS